jgi:hypothetical protein
VLAALRAVASARLLIAPSAQRLQDTLRLIWRNGAQGIEQGRSCPTGPSPPSTWSAYF